jgi:hypothetical protein
VQTREEAGRKGAQAGRQRLVTVGPPGIDVEHDQHGHGWVWGSGLGRVTVRFETRTPHRASATFAVLMIPRYIGLI